MTPGCHTVSKAATSLGFSPRRYRVVILLRKAEDAQSLAPIPNRKALLLGWGWRRFADPLDITICGTGELIFAT
jgi:hypothetical protein